MEKTGEKSTTAKIDNTYCDALQMAFKEVSKTIKQFSAVFNNETICSNLKCKENKSALGLEKKVRDKYNFIPEEYRKLPPLNILGPAIESLKYNIDDEHTNEMFANLIKNCMDSRLTDDIHPRFVKIVEAMSKLDAIVVKYVYEKLKTDKYLPIVRLQLRCNNNSNYLPEAMPEYFCDIIAEDYSLFDISATLRRMQKFGILDINFNEWRDDSVYSSIVQKNEELKEIKSIYQKLHPAITDFNIEIHSKGILKMDDDAKKFAKVVLY